MAAATAAIALAAPTSGCHHRATAAATPPSCPTAPVIVHAQRELDALRGCRSLAGLEIRGAVPFDLTPLEAVEQVDGDLAVRSTFALASVRFPALVRVGGAVMIVSNLDLAGVYLPALVSARTVVITDAPPLLQIMMPSLREVGGDLVLARLPSLELVDLSGLSGLDGVAGRLEAPRIETWMGPTVGSEP
jgi:hypothetical protein